MKRTLAALLALVMALTLLPAAALALDAPTFGGVSNGETYNESKQVTINGPAGAQIFYTTNGDDPTINSTPYNGPISAPLGTESTTYTIKAIAYIPAVEAVQTVPAVLDDQRNEVTPEIPGTPGADAQTSGIATISFTVVPAAPAPADPSAAPEDPAEDPPPAVGGTRASGDPVASITLTPATTKIYMGEPLQLTATILPVDARGAQLEWTSSAPTVATVDDTGLITPVKAGTAKITVKALDGSNVKAERTITVAAKRVFSSITITTKPTYEYAAGEDFDPTGLKIRLNFTNGSNMTGIAYDDGNFDFKIGTGTTARDLDPLKISDKKITVGYTYTDPDGISSRKTITLDITVRDKFLLTGVTLNKTSAILPMGDTLDLVATVNPDLPNNPNPPSVAFSSSNTAVATVDEATGEVTPVKAGTATITATATQTSYGTTVVKTAKCTVSVTAATVKSVTVKTPPNRTTYRVGEKFDPAGLWLTVTYSDGSTLDVPGSQASYNTAAFQSAGSIDFELKYGTASVDQVLTVIKSELVLKSISIDKDPDCVDYMVGDVFDKTGMKVDAVFGNADNETGNVTVENINLSSLTYSPTTFKAGDTKVIVKYKVGTVEKTADVTVTVSAASKPKDIEVTNGPDKMTYFLNESFNPAGMDVTVTFEDNSTRDFTLPATGFLCVTAKGSAKLTEVGQIPINITYTNNKGSFTKKNAEYVAVTNPTLTGLQIITTPAKVDYNLGETLNKTGLTAQLTFTSAGQGQRQLSASELSCTPTTLNKTGVQTITVAYTYGGKKVTDTFAVNVSSSGSPSTGVATIVNCNSWVNVRSGPSTGYSKIGTAPRGAQYTILGTSGNWFQVQYGDKIGWIFGQYISTSGGGGTPSTGVATIVNCNSWVNVRSGPSTGYSKLGTAKRGAQYNILSYVTSSAGNRWYKVQYGNREGWIYGQYVSTTGGGGTSGGSGYGYIGNCNSWVNVRSGPGTKYSKLGTAAKGNQYLILGSSGNWYKIQYTSTKIGWVYGQYLIHGDIVSTRTVYMNNESTVRASASDSSASLGTASAGTSYSYLNTSGSWYMIAFGTRIGYVSAADATLN